MKMPTHIVVDTQDGWTFWKDANGDLFTEGTAKHFAAQRNGEMKPEYQSYVVGEVKPIRSREYLSVLVADRMAELSGETAPMIETNPDLAAQVNQNLDEVAEAIKDMKKGEEE